MHRLECDQTQISADEMQHLKQYRIQIDMDRMHQLQGRLTQIVL